MMKKMMIMIVAVCIVLGGGFALPEAAKAEAVVVPSAAKAVAESYNGRISYSWGTATTYKRSQVASLIGLLKEFGKGVPITQGVNIIAGFTPGKFYTSKDSSYYEQIIEAIKYQNNKTMRGIVLNLTHDGGYWISIPSK